MSGVKEEYLKLTNSNLFYSVTGQGEPIVFIHGNFNDSRIWDYQIGSFAKEYTVIRYDLRGYGKSDTPTAAFSHFEDLKALLDYLGIEKATFVGSSSGGSVAIDFTLKYPEYVKALVLAAPAINGYRYPIRLMIQAIKSISALKSKGFDAAIEKFISNPFWSYFIPSQSKREARELVLRNLKTKKNFYSWDFKLALPLKPLATKRLSEIHVPTFIVLSDKDITFNIRAGEYVHKNIENSKREVLTNCGHLPFVEKPAEFNQKVIQFVKGNLE